MTRFICLLSVVLMSVLAGACGPSLPGITVVHHAKVYTVDDRQPFATAFAYDESGKILLVGDDELLFNRFRGANMIDAQGRTVVPGFIDAHGHLMGLAVGLLQADLNGTRSAQDVVGRLREFAGTIGDDGWLIGRGWDQNDWPEKVFPTAAVLDDAFPDRPVWLTRVDGHAAWANTRAMEEADRDFAGDWQPDGGRIVRLPDGSASGVFVDSAMGLVAQHQPPPSAAAVQQGLDLALAMTARFGLTSVHEAGTSLEALEIYRSRIDDNRFPLRLYAMADGVGEALEYLCKNGPIENYGNRLTARSVKFYADGALGSRGAALFRPYADDPDNRGLLIQTAPVLDAQVAAAMRCGLQVNTHAIGVRGNAVVLDALEAGMATDVSDGRHRIEHAQVVARSHIARFRELDVIASMQPTHATSDMYWAEDRLGQRRLPGAYAWKSFLDAGVYLALGSDFPVESADPLLGFYAAVSRQDLEGWPDGGWTPSQVLTRDQALHGFTLGAAFAAYQENQIGSIKAGKQADFVVLSDNIMEIPAGAIPGVKVLETYLDGKRIFALNP